MNTKERLFLSNPLEWNAEISKVTSTNKALNVRRFHKAYILPLKIKNGHDMKCGCTEGGVCDEYCRFVAGGTEYETTGYTCNTSYSFQREEAIYSKECVVYGGIFYHHFGVMLMRSLSRLWWICNENRRIHVVFLLDPYSPEKAKNHANEVMQLLSLQRVTYSFISQITQFAEIIVPDESYSNHYIVNYSILFPYDRIRRNLSQVNSPYTKIYLSRGNSRNDGINEDYYEHFFSEQGYKVIPFSTMPLKDLATYISGAKEIAYTYGTIANAAVLFSHSDTTHTCLLRANDVDWWFPLHYNMMMLRKIDWYIVESTLNLYPMTHDMGGGAYLYFPTKHFEEYVQKTLKIDYKKPEKIPTKLIARYTLLWASKHIHRPTYFKSLKRPDLFPLLQQYASLVLGKRIDRNKYI